MAEKPVVFDRARYHLDSVREHELPDSQAAVHVGLFFGWATDRGLVARWVEDGAPDAFAAYRRREITGPLLLAAVDDALVDDQFTDVGLAFVANYYDPRCGAYVDDYLRTLAAGLPSEFHVADTRENAERIGAVLDSRYEDWLRTWDVSQGRPDLRSDPHESPELPRTLILPVFPVTSGVPLPNGPLGIRAGRASSVRAIESALSVGRRVWLVALRRPGRHPDPGADDLLDVGVVAELQSAVPSPDHPEARDVVLGCVARAELRRWVDRDALVAEVEVLPEPEPDEGELALLEEVRLRVADVARRRSELGHPPGLLALGAALGGAALLDVVARELPASREELLTVLEAPDLRTRAEVVLGLLDRE